MATLLFLDHGSEVFLSNLISAERTPSFFAFVGTLSQPIFCNMPNYGLRDPGTRGSERSEISVNMEVGEVNQSASIDTPHPAPPGMTCDGRRQGVGSGASQESLTS